MIIPLQFSNHIHSNFQLIWVNKLKTFILFKQIKSALISFEWIYEVNDEPINAQCSLDKQSRN